MAIGHVLKEVATRYIKDALKQDKSLDEIKVGLESNIYGYELDPNQQKKCIERLDRVSANFGIKNVKWNIKCVDALKQKEDVQFDYVVRKSTIYKI